MFDHVSLVVANFGKSLAFYRAALAPLGFVAQHVDEAGKGAAFGPPNEPRLWIGEGKKTSLVHLAFVSKDRVGVGKFHAAAIEHGGRDNGAAGPRTDYSPTYYAAFVIDPDGNNVEAVTHSNE